MKVKSLLLGVLTGTIVAGAGTLLAAPSSGRELRRRIQENKDEIISILSDIKEKALDVKNEVISASSTSKDSLKAFTAEVKNLIQNWQQDIEPHKSEIQMRIAEIEGAIQELEGVVSTPSSEEKEAK
ncbi:YtxH domain-containing protein [Peribacillus kribbensis]|uniref:YtxH domain-containing protein n=1 Tax=Peribacillus kribbensis TaxID=356658 RepID=UPI0003FCCCD5|nr:YtxH domain-containing protein [Peribacillus kribbensis]